MNSVTTILTFPVRNCDLPNYLYVDRAGFWQTGKILKALMTEPKYFLGPDSFYNGIVVFKYTLFKLVSAKK